MNAKVKIVGNSHLVLKPTLLDTNCYEIELTDEELARLMEHIEQFEYWQEKIRSKILATQIHTEEDECYFGC